MNTVIIDARSFKFLPEALEACRLSAVDTVVLTPNDLKLSTRYAGALGNPRGKYELGTHRLHQ